LLSFTDAFAGAFAGAFTGAFTDVALVEGVQKPNPHTLILGVGIGFLCLFA